MPKHTKQGSKTTIKIPGKDQNRLLFGKYRGMTPEEIAPDDPDYIVWMYNTMKNPPCSRALALACEMDVRDAEAERYVDDDDDLDFNDADEGSR